MLRLISLLNLLLLFGAVPALAEKDLASYVDPFIGTGGHGHTTPAATMPFGMVQLGPDTRVEGWDAASGYHADDDVIYGFTHTHLSGTGISDYGDILITAMTGEPTVDNGGGDPDKGYPSRFDKSTEVAEPGYYAVELADYGIGVELTASERVGLHRYRLPEGEESYIIIDLEHRDELTSVELRIISGQILAGFRRSTGWAEDQLLVFAIHFSRPIVRQPTQRSLSKMVVPFGTEGGDLLVKVGLSAVDLNGMQRNMNTEMPESLEGWDFNSYRAAAREAWNQQLGKIEIDGASDAEKTIFYTSLYHSMFAPNVFSDVDGRYRGMDRAVHQAENRRHYTVFSLWDTFRATHPLYTLIERERTREFMETFLAMKEHSGRLPVWELAANETDTMIGYHAVPVMADAWLKGIRDFDGEAALSAMLDSAERDHFGLDGYKRQGFVASEDDGESVSKTLEYAFDDACIARMAASLGRNETANAYAKRSQAWRHLHDPDTGFFRARRNQQWIKPFDPRQVDGNYTEANAWQYSMFVPHDVDGLKEALGGDDALIERLDDLFSADSATTGRDQPDISGMIGQYAHGNEPSHHIAFLYHWAGAPERSAARTRQILEELYTTEADGLPGNEDCGQMSSWYVLASVGIYPVDACAPYWVLVPPLFGSATFNFEDGKTWTVRREGDGEHVVSATLNGVPLQRAWLKHEEIIAGGELVLTLGDEDKGWGRSDRPPSGLGAPVGLEIDETPVPAAPFLEYADSVFHDRVKIAARSADADASIRWAVGDGDLQPYEEPITVKDSSELRFVSESGDARSPAVRAIFRKIPEKWSLTLKEDPDSQYPGSALTLVDGVRGGENWRTGWLGYQGRDFTVTLDQGKKQPLNRVGAGFLQDQKSWIYLPKEVVVSVSDDGEVFRQVGAASHDLAERTKELVLREMVVDLEGVKARYVRLTAVNVGVNPVWHPSAGGDAWVFVDELIVE